MFLSNRIYNIVIVAINVLLLISCSSSSVQRYNRKSEEKKEKVDNSIRFTSGNDKPKSASQNVSSEFDEEPVEEKPVDVNKFIEKHESSSKTAGNLSDREKILYEIVKYINTPYQYGGANKKGIDCSAFTQNVFINSINYTLPRTASEQFNTGREVNSQSNLIFGDLVFFDTTKNSYPGHVGIYLGDGLFAHSSSSRGVTISLLSNSYYQKRFVGGRRTADISN